MRIGDKVAMNNTYDVSDKNNDKVFTVVQGPRVICGTECVWLSDYVGCYAVGGLTVVDSRR